MEAIKPSVLECFWGLPLRDNFEVVLKSLLLLRKFYARLGWEDKIEEVDSILIYLKYV